MKSGRFGAAALMALAASASAQNGASWASGDGALTTLMISGAETPAPAPREMSSADMVETFKKICLDAAGNPATIAAAIASDALDLEATPVTLQGTKKSPPVQLHLWRGPGFVAAYTEGFRVVSTEQCNVTFYPTQLPDRAALAEAMSGVVGSQPLNAAEAVKKNGQPNKYYAPRWTYSGKAGAPLKINAIAMKDSRYMPGDRVLLALTAPAK